MDEIKLGVVETQFADIIWNNEPISSGKLVELCKEQLDWKKSTTYTVLKKLCQKGIFKNEGGIVSKVLSKDEFYAMQSEKFVVDNFGGSLPAFIAAFTQRNNLSKKDIEEIQKMISSFGKGRK